VTVDAKSVPFIAGEVRKASSFETDGIWQKKFVGKISSPPSGYKYNSEV